MITQSHAAWAVFNSLWQGAVIAAAAWIVLRFFRRASAAIRYHVWSAVLVASIVLPVMNLAMPQRVVVVATPPPIVHAPPHAAATSQVPVTQKLPAHTQAARSDARTAPKTYRTPAIARDTHAASATVPALGAIESRLDADAIAIGKIAQTGLPFVFGAWLAIAALMFARLGWGFWRLRTIKRGLVRLDDPAVDAMCRSISRGVAVATSDDVGTPCVIGYVHPVIALPASLASTLDAADLHRVLAHELGHVRRFDDWANLIQQCIRAALFFNPIVHAACRALDVNREIACDDLVAAGLADRIEYAKCLTEIARRGVDVEHLMPAAGFFPDRRQIIVRIEQLLDRDHQGSARVGVVPAASAIVIIVAVAALAAHQLPALAVAPSAVSAAHAAATARVAPKVRNVATPAAAVDGQPAPAAIDQAKAALAMARAAVVKAPALINAPALAQMRARLVQMHAAPMARMQARLALAKAKMASRIAGIAPRAQMLAKAASQVELAAPAAASSVVSPEDDFLDALAAAGYSHLSVDDLIAIRNSGVTAPYLRALKQFGITPMPAKTLIALADSGVSASMIAGMAAAGYSGLKPDELISLQNSGATPAFVQAAKGSLRPTPSVQDLVSLANAGVTGDYVAALAKSGYSRLSASSIIKLEDAGVSSTYLIDLAKLGHVGMSVDSLIALMNAGVSPEYMRALADLGYSSTSTDDLIRMLNAGVTPDLIKRLRAHGFSNNLSVDELIKLAENGF